METIAQEAKRLLEQVPEEQWGVGMFEWQGKCCMFGHWNTKSGRDAAYFGQECRCFMDKINSFLGYSSGNMGFRVNDGELKNYPQSTPKQRVMALLDDMIKAGY